MEEQKTYRHRLTIQWEGDDGALIKATRVTDEFSRVQLLLDDGVRFLKDSLEELPEDFR